MKSGGVESSGVIDTLLDRKLIKVAGRKEALGKPLFYGYNAGFFKTFRACASKRTSSY
jgi:segregation and condensation protein B